MCDVTSQSDLYISILDIKKKSSVRPLLEQVIFSLTLPLYFLVNIFSKSFHGLFFFFLNLRYCGHEVTLLTVNHVLKHLPKSSAEYNQGTTSPKWATAELLEIHKWRYLSSHEKAELGVSLFYWLQDHFCKLSSVTVLIYQQGISNNNTILPLQQTWYSINMKKFFMTKKKTKNKWIFLTKKKRILVSWC